MINGKFPALNLTVKALFKASVRDKSSRLPGTPQYN